MSWFTYYPLPGAPGADFYYLSSRGSSGWSTTGLVPPQAIGSFTCYPRPFMSGDLSEEVLTDGFYASSSSAGNYCAADDPQLVPGESVNSGNLFLTSPGSSVYQLVDVTPPGVGPHNSEVVGGSVDLGNVLFEDEAPLSPGAAPGVGLYDWSGGSVTLVSQVPAAGVASCGAAGPACTPVAGELASSQAYVGPDDHTVAGSATGFVGDAPFTGAVSADGTRVFFQAGGNLYVRRNPVSASATTVQVDASQAGGTGGGGTFQWASSDGSLVFFTDQASAGLTSDTVPGSGLNLYEYDVQTGQLTDLTAASVASVAGVSGVSADGTYVYFVAGGPLVSGAPSGTCTYSTTSAGWVGSCSLYVWHAGTGTRLIATLNAASDSIDWGRNPGSGLLAARVTGSGRYIAFDSTASLTGYDNTPADPGACVDAFHNTGNCNEVYVYDASTQTLRCVSCDSSGAPPTGPADLQTAEKMAIGEAPGYLMRNLLDDGRLFFDSPDALTSAADDGHYNVYEFEPAGVGSCTQADGCLYLISSGSSQNDSFFDDASADGSDVYFSTTQALAGDGSDGIAEIYDARVDGGFAAGGATPPVCASSETCEGTAVQSPSPPSVGTATSGGTFAQSPAPAARVSVTLRRMRGDVLVLTVRVPGPGRVSVSGPDVRTLRRSFSHGGADQVLVGLNATGRRLMKRRGRMRVRVRIAFSPRTGRGSTASASLTIKEG